MENHKDLEVLFQKYVSNSCSREEFHKLLNLLSLPENIDFLENAVSTNWELEGDNPSDNNIDKNAEYLLSTFRNRYKQSLRKPLVKNKIILNRLLLKVAAVLLLLISITLVIQTLPFKRGHKQEVALKATLPSSVTSIAQPGERLNIVLSDGSHVVLKAGSKLESPERFEGLLRNIKLNGEAFFRVKPDKTHPFVVSTDKFTVKVLGTSFNVYSYNNENLARVTVETGRVEVFFNHDNTDESEDFILRPGDQIELNKTTGESKIKHIDVSQCKSWTENELNFERTPLPEVIKRIENCYGVTIALNFKNATKTEITGKYKNESLAGILQLLTFSTNTTYSIQGTKVTIDKNK
ncbi:MAG TPA: FecR domain-containing protein [Bacteroidales bacterium]